MSAQLWQIQLQFQQGDFLLDVDCTSDARVLGLFGPSGSGKTTCLEAIAGLRRHAKGKLSCGEQVWLDSRHDIRLKAEQRHIGYVPQDHLLFPHLNAEANMRFGMAQSANTESHFQTVIEVLELQHLLQHPVHQLSGGQAQRVALARALCAQPSMLMLDEPLAALDEALRHRILPFLLKVRNHFNIPILVVSHNAFELQALCDEVIALKDGRVVAQGAPVEIFTRSDIYPKASPQSFENTVEGKLIEHRSHGSRIDIGHNQLTVPKLEGIAIGSSVLASIPASDILIAKQAIEGLSARNNLKARIEKIDTSSSSVILHTHLENSGAAIIAELTPDATEALDLQTGQPVYLIFKSSSITTYG